MSERIAVRVGEQLIEVPAIRLDWYKKHPKLIELVDWFSQSQALGSTDMGTEEELRKLEALVEEICKVSGYEAALDCSLVDVRRLFVALRGVEAPDPTHSPIG